MNSRHYFLNNQLLLRLTEPKQTLAIELNLLEFAKRLKFNHQTGSNAVFDQTRKDYVSVTPEEMVRQSLILYLNEVQHIPVSLMKSEIPIKIFKQTRRVDLVVYNRHGNPQLLVETKAPQVKLTQLTSDQAAVYNYRLNAPWLMLVNGIEARVFLIDFENKNTTETFTFPSLNLT